MKKKTIHPQPKTRPFPTLAEFKGGIERAGDKVRARAHAEKLARKEGLEVFEEV